MKLIRLLLVVSASLLVSTVCLAAESGEAAASNSEYIKNGLPCIKEICLGDGLDELSKIKWDKATKASASSVKMHKAVLEKNYQGKLIASAPYLIGGDDGVFEKPNFDNQALSKLNEVIASCGESPSLIGKFTTESGNPTTVGISLIPTPDNSQQKWTVVSITRHFPNAVTTQQNDEIRAQLDARYGAFGLTKYFGKVNKDGDARYIPNGGFLSLDTVWPTVVERLRLHPVCGGSARGKVNID